MKHKLILIDPFLRVAKFHVDNAEDMDDYMYEMEGRFILLVDETHVMYVTKKADSKVDLKYHLKKQFGITTI
jgi:predicted type IV restriction endonuclease